MKPKNAYASSSDLSALNENLKAEINALQQSIQEILSEIDAVRSGRRKVPVVPELEVKFYPLPLIKSCILDVLK